jgi:ParB family chromosome partitioning protein
MTNTTKLPTPWGEILKDADWDWEQVIKQYAGQPWIERAYAVRRFACLWDEYDPVANAILSLVEAQNELAQAYSAEQYHVDGAPQVGPALAKRLAPPKHSQPRSTSARVDSLRGAVARRRRFLPRTRKRMTFSTRLTSTIAIGNRHRRDLGDIERLADNIAKIGLLQPIVVTSDGQLVAGQRRLEAAKQLGWSEIPVFIKDDLDAIVRGEFAENAFRKDFTLSEAVAIKRTLEPLERAAAKERQGARTDKHPGKLPTSLQGRAGDKAAQVTGKARRTLEKAEAIVDAAEAEPERFGTLLTAMDRSGRVNGVFKRLRVARQAALIRAEPPPLPGRGAIPNRRCRFTVAL